MKKGIDKAVEGGMQICEQLTHSRILLLSVFGDSDYDIDRGEGDLHDVIKFSKYRKTIALTSPGMFINTSATYTLSMYPNEDFFKVYSTNNKVIATVGSVCIIIFTSLLFLLYDFFVRQEIGNQRAIMEAKRKFMRFVSHEVRTPLNSICMGLQLMQDEIQRFILLSQKGQKPDSEKLNDWADLNGDILKNAHSAVTVLSDLLNYDKIEQGNFKLELSVVNIWELVERTSAEFMFPAATKSINFQVDFHQLITSTHSQQDSCAIPDAESGLGNVGASAASLPRDVREHNVVGDTIRITQVLRNFLSNAIKFTPEKGDITVRVSWKKPTTNAEKSTQTTFTLNRGDEVSFSQSGFVRIAVTDSGAGMSDDQLAKVFGEFVQFNVNELQVGQGSGLGLFISKGIAEQHGGSLSVASKGLGHGTTFTLTIPLYHTPDSALPDNLKRMQRMQRLRVDTCPLDRESENNLESFSSYSGTPLRILVVDDTTMNRKLLVRLLTNKGHICHEAPDGRVAVKKVEAALHDNDPYNSILMDYEMPVMNGPTAVKEIRALGCDSFIVGVTGNLLPEDIAYFKTCGANSVLPKPLELAGLEELWMEHGVAMSMH
jgi:signal transduction histidine kinase/CheY-like chemotaxis protein